MLKLVKHNEVLSYDMYESANYTIRVTEINDRYCFDFKPKHSGLPKIVPLYNDTNEICDFHCSLGGIWVNRETDVSAFVSNLEDTLKLVDELRDKFLK